jgi:hypothetical protein
MRFHNLNFINFVNDIIPFEKYKLEPITEICDSSCRYNHENDHLTIQKLGLILEKRPKSIPNVNKITKLKPCMPDHCVISNDTINSYRNYYKLEKRGFATWKQPAEIPYWY